VEAVQTRPEKVIRDTDVTDLGGVESALAKYVDNKVKGLPVTSQEQRALRDLFDALYTRQPDGRLTRTLMPVQQIINSCRGAQAREPVQHACADDVRILEVNRLLVAGTEADYVSLSQDALARVGETWAEERRNKQYGRSRIIDMLWIFIPLIVLAVAITIWWMRQRGGTGGSEGTVPIKDYEALVRTARQLQYSMNIGEADKAWRAGSAFMAREHVNTARDSLPDGAETPFEW